MVRFPDEATCVAFRHKLRSALHEWSEVRLAGLVEPDETWVAVKNARLVRG